MPIRAEGRFERMYMESSLEREQAHMPEPISYNMWADAPPFKENKT